MQSNLLGVKKDMIPASKIKPKRVKVQVDVEWDNDPHCPEEAPAPRRRTDIEQRIYETYQTERKKQSPHRRWMGASDVGNECARAVFYTFRNAMIREFDPRILKLFDRGHREEEVVERDFSRAGIPISATSDGVNQHSFTDDTQHFRSHLDGLVELDGRQLLAEIKTMSKWSFAKLEKMGGVRYSHPNYYAQMHAQAATAERSVRIDGGLFIANCKDNDEIWVEEIDIDPVVKAAVMGRAKAIIGGAIPPRVDCSDAAPPCKWCDFKPLCKDHRYDLVDKNCRSCDHAESMMGGQWRCKIGQPFGTPCAQWAQHRGF